MLKDFDGWFETVVNDYEYCACGNTVWPGRKAFLKINFKESIILIEELICEKCMMVKYPMLFIMEKMPF